MKKHFKKFSIMFVMLLTVIGVGISQNGIVANAAIFGQPLLQPEDGWKRYDDSDSDITYIGSWHADRYEDNIPGLWYATCHTTLLPSQNIRFNFTGSKIRLLCYSGDDRATASSINIDGKVYWFSSANLSISKGRCLVFDKTELSNNEHYVEINSGINYACPKLMLDAIDIGQNEKLKPYNQILQVMVSNILLNKSTDNIIVGQIDTLRTTIAPDNAINKNIIWKSSDPSKATVDSNGKVTAIKEGQAMITATTTDGSNLSATCIVTVTPNPIVVPPVQPTTSSAVVLSIKPEKPQIHLKERVSADLVIDNIKEIAAEDVRIKYDNTKLKFLGVNEINGIRLVKPVYKDGELRFILASKGTVNVANAKKVLLTLKFQGIASGDALVDITKGKVSDGITMEKDLTDAECGQATIKIDDAVLKDVNNTGEFTLLDLAIDARHLGEDPTTLTQYNTDQVINGAIDDDDLIKISEYMIANPN